MNPLFCIFIFPFFLHAETEAVSGSAAFMILPATTTSVVSEVQGQDMCAFANAKMAENCRKFASNPDIPRDALEWTLNVYRQNIDGLKLKKCLKDFDNSHYSLTGLTRDKLEQGIKNKCQIKINDTRRRPKGFVNRGTYFYLDLCDGSQSTGYFNLGNRTDATKFSNQPGSHATVLGAFLTSDKEFSYEPQVCAKSVRKKVRKRWTKICVKTKLDPDYVSVIEKVRKLSNGKKRSPALALVGLQGSNNNSATAFKYEHVSPYSSSWGCPSMAPEDYTIIEEQAKNGPSLVVNYGPNMEDPAKCSVN